MTNNAASSDYTIMPSLRQKETYNDNLFLVDEDNKEDFVHLTKLLLKLDHSSYYSRSDLNYNVEFSNYSKNAELNNTKHDLDLQLNIKPSSTIFLDITNHYRSSEEVNLNHVDIEKRPLSTFVRKKRILDDFFIAINKEITGRSKLYFKYDRHFEDVEIEQELDENSNRFATGIDIKYGRKKKHILTLLFESRDYSFKENIGEKTERGFKTYLFNVGSLFDISSVSKFNLYGGIARSEDNNRDSLSEDNNFIAGGGYYKFDFNNTSIMASYDHTITSGYGFGKLVVKDTYLLVGKKRILPKLIIDVSIYFRDNNYVESNITGSRNDNKLVRLSSEIRLEDKERYFSTISYSLYRNDYSEQEVLGISDYEQSTVAFTTAIFISKYMALRAEYKYTWRRSMGEQSNANNVSFRRNLITLGIILGAK